MEKTVIITGASRGIGAACAKAFAKAGFNTAICYNKNKEKAVALADELGENAAAFEVDVANSGSVAAMYKAVCAKFGEATVLVNNAGISQQKLFTDITEDDWDAMQNANIKGIFLCCKAVLPAMIKRKSGRIINISSMWGVSGASCEVHYSASKAAVIGLTKALAKEEGPSGITVNCIAPGVIETDMMSSFSDDDKQILADETPLCRLGTPQDVANAALFFASDAAAFITGQVLCVDGGFVV